MRLAIFGCGGMGRELADIVRARCAVTLEDYDIIFVSDEPTGSVQGIPVIHPDDLQPTDRICFALGSSEARKVLSERFRSQPLATICSVSSIVSPSATIGEGSILCDYAIVNNSSCVGRHFQGNAFSQVSHDCIIGNYVTFSPRVSCNGWVQIDDGVFVGAGAIIRNGSSSRRLHIGERAIIGMGAVVIKDVPAGTTVVGVPARRVLG